MPELITSGWRSAQTHHGDTLARIAYRELQDASRWPEIAWLNNLAPPYLTTNPAHPQLADGRVVLIGGVIKIPVPTTATQGVSPAESFGVDVLLTNGRLTATANGGLDTAVGVKNLRQALELRLMNEVGCLPFHPKYGNAAHRLRGHKASAQANLLALRYCEECLLGDPRVVSVRNGSAETVGDAIYVAVEALVDDGSALKLQIEI